MSPEELISLPQRPSAAEPTPTIPVGRAVPRGRIRLGLLLTLTGLLVFLLGARPSLFGLDRSPVIGFVQIAVFLIGLAVIAIGGYIAFSALWVNRPRSILADIGLRLVSTGYVIAVFAGMADVFGFGSHPLTHDIPYFGRWQARGVEAAEVLMLLGFVMMLPWGSRSAARSAPPPPDHPA